MKFNNEINSQLSIHSFPVPPTHLEIVSDQGVVASNSVIGPYKEGSSVNITCMSGGGKCLVSSRNDPFLHTITSSSPFHFLYGFYGRIYIILLYIYTFIRFDVPLFRQMELFTFEIRLTPTRSSF